jgi:hypothetical protein
VREVTARAGPRGYVGEHLCFLPACVALSMGAIDTVPTLENARRWLKLMHIGPALACPYSPLPCYLIGFNSPRARRYVIL